VVTEVLQQLTNGLVLGSIYALISIGLTMSFGMLHIIQWAHGEVYMLGAYTAFYCVEVLHLDYITAVLVAVGAMALFGVLMEWGVFRPLRPLGPKNSMLGAIALSIVLLNTATVVFQPEPVSMYTPFLSTTYQLGGVSLNLQRLLILVIGVGTILVITQFLKRHRMGKAMRAFEEDQEAAALVGVDVNRVALITLAIGSALAGLAGGLVGPIFLVYPTMAFMAVGKAFVVVILGGLGSVPGAIAGGFVLGMTESLVAGFISSYWKDVAAFVILILVLSLRPQGLLGKSVPEKV
jgi:branched-chain amino acid transport system permease protein